MVEDKKNLPAKRVGSGFLDKVRSSKVISAAPKQEMLTRAIAHTERPRLLFAMDATASREACWNVAKEITGAMFEAVPGELDVALAYHSGGRLQEMTPFSSEARAFLDKVQAVRCSAGRTALNEILDKAAQTPKLKALIYTGDCFAQITGGAILPFDESSPNLVKELLSAIALYAAQGIKALKQQTKLLPAARLLLEQMK